MAIYLDPTASLRAQRVVDYTRSKEVIITHSPSRCHKGTGMTEVTVKATQSTLGKTVEDRAARTGTWGDYESSQPAVALSRGKLHKVDIIGILEISNVYRPLEPSIYIVPP